MIPATSVETAGCLRYARSSCACTRRMGRAGCPRILVRHCDKKTIALSRPTKVGIGYVSGGNDVFRLRPSPALQLGGQQEFLSPKLLSGAYGGDDTGV